MVLMPLLWIPLVLGFLALFVLIWSLLRLASFHLWIPTDPLRAYRSNGRTYALITGATAGIGLGFAHSLATRGFGVILLARSQENLDKAEAEIKGRHPDATVHKLSYDATSARIEDVEALIKTLPDVPISILINNLGGNPITPPKTRRFDTFTKKEIDDTLAFNAGLSTHLTRIMMPILLKNSRSLILNLSSGASLGTPWSVVYSAAKSYNRIFSYGLAREFIALKVPIDCVAILPGSVKSPANNVPLSLVTPTAEHFAKLALDKVDTAVSRRMLEMRPYWIHDLQLSFADWTPSTLLTPLLIDEMIKRRKEYAKSE